MEYYTSRRIDGDFDEVVDRVVEALEEEGFGILADIDVEATFEGKLDVEDYPKYRILGACNAPLAKEALESEPNLGALLPCNVVVYEPPDGEGVIVSAVDPEAMLSVVDNPDLDPIARDVAERFDRVLSQIAFVI